MCVWFRFLRWRTIIANREDIKNTFIVVLLKGNLQSMADLEKGDVIMKFCHWNQRATRGPLQTDYAHAHLWHCEANTKIEDVPAKKKNLNRNSEHGWLPRTWAVTMRQLTRALSFLARSAWHSRGRTANVLARSFNCTKNSTSISRILAYIALFQRCMSPTSKTGKISEMKIRTGASFNSHQ